MSKHIEIYWLKGTFDNSITGHNAQENEVRKRNK